MPGSNIIRQLLRFSCGLRNGLTLSASSAFKLNGGVLDTKFGKMFFEFCHDAVILCQQLIRRDDVCAQGDVAGANAPDVQIMYILHAGYARHALADSFH